MRKFNYVRNLEKTIKSLGFDLKVVKNLYNGTSIIIPHYLSLTKDLKRKIKLITLILRQRSPLKKLITFMSHIILRNISYFKRYIYFKK